MALVEEQTLAVVIRRNTAMGAELQADCFRLPCDAWGVEPGVCDLVAPAGAVKGDEKP